MKKMLLSFSYNVFNKVILGEKIFEHRKVFPNDTIEAYLYVSAPIKAITGIMILQNRTDLLQWREKYSYDSAAALRIEEYMKIYKYVMEIRKFQKTNSISLEKLRNDLPGFVVPQMYYYLDGTDLLVYLENELFTIGTPIEHDFSNITSEMICVH